MSIKNMMWLLGLAVLTASCLDQIELDQPERPSRGMVIQGRISLGDPIVIEANVNELFVYTTNLPNPIGGATVKIYNDQNQSLTLITNYDGTYYRSIPRNTPEFVVNEGGSYQLEVLLPNGKRYLSGWESMLQTPSIDSLNYSIVQREVPTQIGTLTLEDFLAFEVSGSFSAPNDTRRSMLYWEIDQSFRLTEAPTNPAYVNNAPRVCYLSYRLISDNVRVLDGREAGQGYFTRYPIQETRLDYRFAEGYYLTVLQHRLSEGAFTYLNQVSQLLASRGTLFDSPPGSISTNMSSPTNPDELVYGYFYATSPDTLRLYLSPEELNNPARYCPLPPPDGAPAPVTVCDDCFISSSASTQKPPYWIE